MPVFCRVRLTAYLAGALSRICQCIRSCFGAWTHGLPSLPALRAWPAPSWANASSTGLRGTGEPRRCGAGCGAGAYRDHRSISNGTSQARSAGREARGLPSKMQNTLGGSPNCGGAVLGGTGSDAAGRGPAIHIGTGSGQPPYLGEFDPCGQIRPQRLFSFGPCTARFLFSAQPKRENGGCIAQPSPWLNSPPPVRASITPASGSVPADNLL